MIGRLKRRYYRWYLKRLGRRWRTRSILLDPGEDRCDTSAMVCVWWLPDPWSEPYKVTSIGGRWPFIVIWAWPFSLVVRW